MAHTSDPAICVIIAAKNAEDTIARAIRSALAEPVVAEVVVVDDGSSDRTRAAAEAADDGTSRLQIIAFAQNRGPSAARNAAIAASRAPLIAILDADDFFFPGRFAPMLAETDWDLLADNIAFIQDPAATPMPEQFQARPRTISLVEFVEGNISRRGRPRGEIGFLKPVMRRAFLDAETIRYDEKLRLGEDYDLYLRALARGARYKVIEHCGYGAVVRQDSLSSRHRTEDLRMLYEADEAILQDRWLPADARTVIAAHRDHIRERYEHRAFLDTKARSGLLGALGRLLRRPQHMLPVARGVFFDKLDAARQKSSPAKTPSAPMRYLLAGVPAAQK